MPGLVPGIRDFLAAAAKAALRRKDSRSGDVRGQKIEPVLEPKLARDAALNLAAGRLRQRARTDKHHMASEDLMFVCHRFADSSDHVGDVDAAPVHALDLLDDNERFIAVLIRNRERRAAVVA